MAHKRKLHTISVPLDRMDVISNDILAHCESKGYNVHETALVFLSLGEFLSAHAGMIPSEVAEFKRACRKCR